MHNDNNERLLFSWLQCELLTEHDDYAWHTTKKLIVLKDATASMHPQYQAFEENIRREGSKKQERYIIISEIITLYTSLQRIEEMKTS